MPFGHIKCRQRPVHAGRHIGQVQPFADLLKIDGQLVSQVNIAIHDACHELDGMVRFQPASLVTDHRISRRVGFVEAIVGELVQQVPDLGRLGLIHVILGSPFEEFGPLGVHRLLDFLTHRAAQQVCTPKAVPRHFLRDLHHLFLIDDDTLGLVQNMVDGGMQRVPFAQLVLDLTELGNVLHRARPVKRDEGDDILNTVRLHPLERVHHARAFHLEHRHGLGRGIELVRRLIIQRDGVDLVFGPLGGFIKLGAIRGDVQRAPGFEDQIHCVLNDSQGFQTQKVELHQPGLFHPFHIELGGGHVGARVLIDRNQRVQRSVADHHPRRVGRGVAQQPFDLLAIGEQTFHDLFAARFLAQTRFVFQRLFDGDRFDALDRDHLGKAVHLPVRHLQDPPNIAHGSLGQQRTKGDDLPHLVAPIFLLHIADHFFTAIHAEVDIEVGHRDPFRIQEPLEQQ